MMHPLQGNSQQTNCKQQFGHVRTRHFHGHRTKPKHQQRSKVSFKAQRIIKPQEKDTISNIRGDLHLRTDLPMVLETTQMETVRQMGITLREASLPMGIQEEDHPMEEGPTMEVRVVTHPTVTDLRGATTHLTTDTPADPTDHQVEDRQTEDHQVAQGVTMT